MNNETTHRRPITALRRCETGLESLQAEVRTLADQLQQIAKFAEDVTECRRELDALAESFDRELATLRSDVGFALKSII